MLPLPWAHNGPHALRWREFLQAPQVRIVLQPPGPPTSEWWTRCSCTTAKLRALATELDASKLQHSTALRIIGMWLWSVRYPRPTVLYVALGYGGRRRRARRCRGKRWPCFPYRVPVRDRVPFADRVTSSLNYGSATGPIKTAGWPWSPHIRPAFQLIVVDLSCASTNLSGSCTPFAGVGSSRRRWSHSP